MPRSPSRPTTPKHPPQHPPQHPPRSISIRDVAERAGVSLGSASRVINQAPNVTAETRAKVEQAIAALGYRPNHAAQSLRLRTTHTVGCLLSDVTNPLYARLFRAFEEPLRRAGYMLLLANGLNQVAREVEILATFQGRRMDGLLLAPGHERDRQLLQQLRSLAMPAVLIDRDVDAPLDRVLFDHVPGMHQVVAHLAALGHRRMALLVSGAPIRPMRCRIDGFRRAHQAAGLALDEAYIVRLPSSTSPAYDTVRTLLGRTDRPTALVAMGTSVLSDSLNAAAACGLSVPRDLSVVAIGDPDFAARHVPPISTLRVDLAQAGDAGSQLLLARLQGEGGAPRSTLLPCEWVVRASCGPALRA